MSLRSMIYMDKRRKMEGMVMDEKVKNLIERMTVEEKVYQMCAILSSDTILENGRFSPVKAKKSMGKGIGQISACLRDLPPGEGAKLANQIQKFAVKETRLGIPVIIHDECIHGCMARGSTSFPQSIGLASTWNPELVKKIAVSIGKETKTRGIAQCLSPTINITRDPRCGRTEETYGEDPWLTSRMAVSFISGVQSEGVAATPKHLAANFVGDGGRDSDDIHFSERILREIYFPAFEASIKEAGALSVMPAYNSLDGIPCSCNRWLLTDILRKEWGFKGIFVSDYGAVDFIYSKHSVAETKGEAAKKAVEAGMDIELPGINCFKELIKVVKEGKMSIEVIDAAVSRILQLKFQLGLFDNPYVDANVAVSISDCKEHRRLALKAACESIVLLKNSKNVLPLGHVKSIAVIGPNADEIRLGGYSTSGTRVVTPLEGIKNRVSRNTEVYFAEGCKVNDGSRAGFKEAISTAEKSDVAVLVMGNLPMYEDGGTEGESADRCNLDLPGVQEELIREVCNAGKPVVVVLISGSAVTMSRWVDEADALLEAWYPGEEGGNAIADVLFGRYNPAGRLPLTFPKTTGQLPLYYNHKPTGRVYDYVDMRGEQPLFPFGFGLSYTKFRYSNLKIKPGKIAPNGKVKVFIRVENIGKCKGDEVVQLYLRDVVSSVSRPVKELKRFKRITLSAGKKKTVEFALTERDLSFLDRHLEPVVEPGTFEVMVGGSSAGAAHGKFQVV